VKRTLSQLSYAPREAQSIGSVLATSEVQVDVAEELGEVDRLRQARHRAEAVHMRDLGLDGAGRHHDDLEIARADLPHLVGAPPNRS
jgi:hypothetical protein